MDGIDFQISVVIIGRNEGEKLNRCIQSVLNMDYSRDDYEIIYVDSDSTDGSIDTAQNLKVDKVISLVTDNPCAAAGRNRGLNDAKGEFVLFLDGDTEIKPDFIRKAIPCFSNPQIAIVYGDRYEINLDEFYIKLCAMDWNRTYGFTETSGGDILIRKSITDVLGGYYEIIAGEDPELSNRVINAGYKILHLETDMVSHDLGIDNFKKYWKHAIRSGFAYSIVASLTKDRPVTLWVNINRKIMVHAIAIIGIFLSSCILSMSFSSIIPGILFFLLLNLSLIFLLMIKSSLSFSNWKIKLAYFGLHCHFLKIPLFLGQIRYYFNKKQKLIEYK